MLKGFAIPPAPVQEASQGRQGLPGAALNANRIHQACLGLFEQQEALFEFGQADLHRSHQREFLHQGLVLQERPVKVEAGF